MKNPKLLYLLCLAFLSNVALSQTPPFGLNTFSISELQEDFTYMRDRIEQKHPLIYLYTPKANVDRFLDSLYQQITYPMTELAFIKLLTPIAALIQDGHNYVIPSKAALDSIRGYDYLFPMELKCIEGRLYVARDLSLSSAPLTGLEITAINSTTTNEMMAVFLSNLGRDGHNAQHAYAAINESFRFYYHTYFGFDTSYVVHYRTKDNIDSSCIIAGRDLDAIKKEKLSRYPMVEHGPESDLTFNIIDSMQTAVLGIKTFSPDITNRKFRTAISTYFDSIRNADTKYLVLDLRDNRGGNPNHVKFILQHLFDEPFEQAKECRVVKRKQGEDFYVRTRKQWYPWYGIGKYNPEKNNFTGPLFVLVNEGTYSAGVILCSVLHRYKRAVFIGNETGGNPIIMAGYLIKSSWELPNTKIQFGSGTLCTLYDELSRNQGRGLVPDHVIQPLPVDLLTTRDRFLEYALQLIN